MNLEGRHPGTAGIAWSWERTPEVVRLEQAVKADNGSARCTGQEMTGRKHKFTWLIWGAISVLVVAVAAVVLTPSPKPMLHRATALVLASKQCAAGELADGNKTLVLDMEGKDFGSGSMSIEQVMCVLTALNTPSFVLAEMQKTRALDGRQSQTWEALEASWTYHPDDGLDIIVRQVK